MADPQEEQNVEGADDPATPVRRLALAKRRRDEGFTQESLAEHLQVSRSTVARWERGEGEPLPGPRVRLGQALGVSSAELDVLLGADELPAVAGWVGSEAERLQQVSEGHVAVDVTMLAALRRSLSRLDSDYESMPSTALLPAAGECLAQVTQLRSRAPAGLQPQLLSLEAEAATLMGILIWDSSQRRQIAVARSYFDQAQLAAQEVGDRLTQAYAQLRICYLARYGQDDPVMGLMTAQHAKELAPASSRVLEGLTTLHIAEAHAMQGRRRPCEQALAEAERSFERVQGSDEAIRFYSPSQLNRMAGSCYLFLGQPQKAEPILEHAARTAAPASKSRAIVLENLGLAHARQGQVDASVGVLHTATDVIERNRGGGGMNVVFSAALELRPWRDLPMVQEVHDRLLMLGRA
jgi:transcriptional regulator with XRE-family HTH domain